MEFVIFLTAYRPERQKTLPPGGSVSKPFIAAGRGCTNRSAAPHFFKGGVCTGKRSAPEKPFLAENGLG